MVAVEEEEVVVEVVVIDEDWLEGTICLAGI